MELFKQLIADLEPVAATPIAEATGPIPYESLLDQIVSSGKSGAELDSVENFCLGNLSWFFSSGRTSVNGQMSGLVDIESTATTTAMVDYIKTLSAEQVAELATELKFMVVVGDRSSPATIQGEFGMTPIQWMEYVLRRQD